MAFKGGGVKLFKLYIYIFETAWIDISAGSVLARPNLTTNISRDEHKHLDRIKSKYVFISIMNINFFTVLFKMHLSVKMIQDERLLDSFHMSISGMKTTFYTNFWGANMSEIRYFHLWSLWRWQLNVLFFYIFPCLPSLPHFLPWHV